MIATILRILVTIRFFFQKSLFALFEFEFVDLQELKVFVDLASISAGEGAMEVDRVKCLHAATTGYAPLIFNLDKHCDSKMFLEKCELVWKELASDPNLPKKLVSERQNSQNYSASFIDIFASHEHLKKDFQCDLQILYKMFEID